MLNRKCNFHIRVRRVPLNIVGGWLAASAVMGCSFVDYLFLRKHIVSDLEQFMTGPPHNASNDFAAIAVPFTLKPEEEGSSPPSEDAKGDKGRSDDGDKTAESSKEE